MITEIVNHNKIKFLANLWVVVLTLFLGFTVVSATGSWKVVGSAGFSAGWANYETLAFDSNDILYVGFVDYANNGKATVMKFDGSKWVTVGSAGFSAGSNIYYLSLAIDSNDVLYLAFQDTANNDKATVMKFDGSKWVTVGSAGFSAGSASLESLSFDSNNAPYLAFQDAANGWKATVMKFDGSKWVTVGSAGFSANAAWLSLDIGSNDIPYIAIEDGSQQNKATVMKFDGSKWVTVGSAGFSAYKADDISIAINSNNDPYVVYSDDGGAATVMTYDNSASKWVNVGSVEFSQGNISWPSLVFSSNDVPYVAFHDGYNYDKITVMNFDYNPVTKKTEWVTVGSAGFSASSYNLFPAIAMDSKDIPHVVFGDGSKSGKVTVMAFSRDAYWQDTNVKITKSNSYNSEITSIATDSQGNKYVAFSDSDNGDRATLIKYTESSRTWSKVGIAGFTPDRAMWTSLAFDTNDTPYVAYGDMANPDSGNIGKASVMKYAYNSTSGRVEWFNVGSAGFSTDGAEYTRLAIDKNNILYVTFVDNIGSSMSLTTMKYDSMVNKWVYVGRPGFSTSDAWYPSIAFDNLNVPHVVYRDRATGKAQAVKFDGKKWITVGQPLFSPGTVDYTVIKFDSNNIPYVSFQDWSSNGRATVMKLTGGVWTNLGNSAFSTDTTYATSLFIYKNIPYVSMSYVSASNPGTGDGVSVMKYNSTTNKWELVGNELFSPEPTYFSQITVDKFGVPYVSFIDSSGAVKVMRFN